MFANLKISRKLSLLLLLPMSAFLFIVAVESYHRFEEIDDLHFVEHALSASLSLGQVIHEIQKERGYTAGFISSHGQRFASELGQQIALTDKAQKQFTTVLDQLSRQEPPSFKTMFNPVLKKLDELASIRLAVKSFKIDTLQAIANYNSCISDILDVVSALNARAEATCVSVSFSSILQIMRGKDVAGQERASLSAAFAAGSFSKQLYRDWLYRVSAQDTFLFSFIELGGTEAKALLQQKTKGTNAEVKHFRDIAYETPDDLRQKADPAEWFAAATRHIDSLMEVETVWGDMLLGHAKGEVSKAQKNLWVNCSSALLVAVITILLGWKICITIGRPLRRTLQYAEKVTKGDFDVTLAVDQKDEIGGLADALRTMVGRLKAQIERAKNQHALAEERGQIADQCRIAAEKSEHSARAKADSLVLAVEKIRGVVETVGIALNNLSGQIHLSSEGAATQAHRLDDTTSAMEEMSATVIEVAKNAAGAAQTAGESGEKATEGSSIVETVVNAILQVQTQSDEMKVDMGLLGQQAEGIGQILNVISDIADQTNLLALNAAIEAARAGDAGRGFAVVADEVRKLAEKTMSATKEVGEAVQGIQGGTRKHISHVEQTAGTIEKATLLAQQSGQSLRELVELAKETTNQVQSIATASEEQSAASETIHASLEDINQIASATAEAMEQAIKDLTELHAQADVLVGVMADLKEE